MWRKLLSQVGEPDALLIAGALLAVSAVGNRMLGGPDLLVAAFGVLGAVCFGAAITIAALRYERRESS